MEDKQINLSKSYIYGFFAAMISTLIYSAIIIPFYILNGFPFYYLIGQYTEILMIVLISGVLVLSIVSGIIYTYNGRYLFKDLSNKN